MKERNTGDEKKIESLVDVSLDKIRSLIDVNCVVGNAISMPDGSSIIPISKVSVGFVSGGGEYNDLNAKRNAVILFIIIPSFHSGCILSKALAFEYAIWHNE